MKTDTNEPARSSVRQQAIFFMIVIALIAAAIIRSSITTSLDSFTFDEAYHVGAGAAYVQTGDFRLNPEQPPYRQHLRSIRRADQASRKRAARKHSDAQKSRYRIRAF